MTRRAAACAATIVGLAVAAPLWAASPAKKPASQPAVITTKEIHRGMKGYGLTVFEGAKIERFGVEVLDVIHKWSAKGDLILIRMSGGPLARSGIIAGMSGSPVYLDGRLAGAVAYGWLYAKEPIAGVTPAAEMLHVLKAPPEDPIKPAAAMPPGESGWYEELRVPVPHLASYVGIAHGPAPLELTPVQTPLMMGGFSPAVVRRVRERWGSFGLLPVQAAGTGARQLGGKPPKVEPGCAVGIELLRGDLEMSAVGTLTWRDRDRFVAFGHPMFGTGVSSMSVAVAHVHTVLASVQRSFKMASPVRSIGRLTVDRYAAVAGTLGPAPAMIPCTLSVDGQRRLEYRFEAVDDKVWAPRMIETALAQAVEATERTSGYAMVHLRLEVHVDKLPQPIVMENLFHANPIVPVWLLTSPLYQLSYNDFAEVHITKVAGRVAVREGRRTASIAEVRVSSTTVKPGDALDVYVTLKPFGAASVVKTAKLTIPRDTKPGTTVIVDVCDASTSRSLDRAAAPGRYRPRNLAQLVRIMAEREPNTHLFVRATLPTMGVTIRGEPYPALPAAMMSALAFSNATGVGPLRETVVERVPTQWVLSGRQQRRILVQEETER